MESSETHHALSASPASTQLAAVAQWQQQNFQRQHESSMVPPPQSMALVGGSATSAISKSEHIITKVDQVSSNYGNSNTNSVIGKLPNHGDSRSNTPKSADKIYSAMASSTNDVNSVANLHPTATTNLTVDNHRMAGVVNTNKINYPNYEMSSAMITHLPRRNENDGDFKGGGTPSHPSQHQQQQQQQQHPHQSSGQYYPSTHPSHPHHHNHYPQNHMSYHHQQQQQQHHQQHPQQQPQNHYPHHHNHHPQHQQHSSTSVYSSKIGTEEKCSPINSSNVISNKRSDILTNDHQGPNTAMVAVNNNFDNNKLNYYKNCDVNQIETTKNCNNSNYNNHHQMQQQQTQQTSHHPNQQDPLMSMGADLDRTISKSVILRQNELSSRGHSRQNSLDGTKEGGGRLSEEMKFKSNPLYVSNPDFTKVPAKSASQQQPPLVQLQMKTPDFSKLTTQTASPLHVSNPDFSSYKTGSKNPETVSPHVTPSNFAEISKKYNYISDLQLKKPPVSELAPPTPIATSQSYPNLYVKAPDFTSSKIQFDDRSSSNKGPDEPTPHVIHKNHYAKVGNNNPERNKTVDEEYAKKMASYRPPPNEIPHQYYKPQAPVKMTADPMKPREAYGGGLPESRYSTPPTMNHNYHPQSSSHVLHPQPLPASVIEKKESDHNKYYPEHYYKHANYSYAQQSRSSSVALPGPVQSYSNYHPPQPQKSKGGEVYPPPSRPQPPYYPQIPEKTPQPPRHIESPNQGSASQSPYHLPYNNNPSPVHSSPSPHHHHKGLMNPPQNWPSQSSSQNFRPTQSPNTQNSVSSNKSSPSPASSPQTKVPMPSSSAYPSLPQPKTDYADQTPQKMTDYNRYPASPNVDISYYNRALHPDVSIRLSEKEHQQQQHQHYSPSSYAQSGPPREYPRASSTETPSKKYQPQVSTPDGYYTQGYYPPSQQSKFRPADPAPSQIAYKYPHKSQHLVPPQPTPHPHHQHPPAASSSSSSSYIVATHRVPVENQSAEAFQSTTAIRDDRHQSYPTSSYSSKLAPGNVPPTRKPLDMIPKSSEIARVRPPETVTSGKYSATPVTVPPIVMAPPPVEITIKKESPLDLSVKTIKTKADSTGCDSNLISPRQNSALKVDFYPNFSNHEAARDQRDLQYSHSSSNSTSSSRHLPSSDRIQRAPASNPTAPQFYDRNHDGGYNPASTKIEPRVPTNDVYMTKKSMAKSYNATPLQPDSYVPHHHTTLPVRDRSQDQPPKAMEPMPAYATPLKVQQHPPRLDKNSAQYQEDRKFVERILKGQMSTNPLSYNRSYHESKTAAYSATIAQSSQRKRPSESLPHEGSLPPPVKHSRSEQQQKTVTELYQNHLNSLQKREASREVVYSQQPPPPPQHQPPPSQNEQNRNHYPGYNYYHQNMDGKKEAQPNYPPHSTYNREYYHAPQQQQLPQPPPPPPPTQQQQHHQSKPQSETYAVAPTENSIPHRNFQARPIAENYPHPLHHQKSQMYHTAPASNEHIAQKQPHQQSHAAIPTPAIVTVPVVTTQSSTCVTKVTDQNIISKLRTNLAMKEMEKQKLLNKQSSVELPNSNDEENSRSDINSILAARIRTKGELKGFHPIPLPPPQPPIAKPRQLSPKPDEIEEDNPTMELHNLMDSEAKTAFDLMDWGKTCTEFVEMLQTGESKKRIRHRTKTRTVPLPVVTTTTSPNDAKPEEIEKEVPEFQPSKNSVVIPEDENKVGESLKKDHSSSDEDKPLLVLRQRSTVEKTEIEKMDDNSNSSFLQKRNMADKIERNMKEKQRLEREKMLAAKLGTSSSDTEIENQAIIRPRKRIRKPKTRASLNNKKLASNDDTDEENDEVTPKKNNVLTRSKDTESPQKELRKKPFNRIMETPKSSSGDESEKPAIIPDEKSAADEKSKTTESAATIIQKPKNTNLENSLSKYDEMAMISSCPIVSLNKITPPKTTPAKRLSVKNVDAKSSPEFKEETMTRSKRKREIEQQASNCKVLRNEKVVLNIITPKNKQTPTKKLSPQSGNKSEDTKRKVDTDTDEKQTPTKLNKKLRTVSSDSESVSEESEVETCLTERLRSKKSKSVDEKTAANTKVSKDEQTVKVKEETPSKSSKAVGKAQVTPKRGSAPVTSTTSPKQVEAVLIKTNFTPGWEHDVYHYKRSLKIPPSLISVRPRISTSLPDLDHSSDASEFSERSKASTSKLKDKTRDTSTESAASKKSAPKAVAEAKSKQPSPKSLATPKVVEHVVKKQVPTNEGKSIIDVLHQRVGMRMVKSKKFQRVVVSGEPKLIPQIKEAELLSTPGVENSDAIFGKKMLFDTVVLKSRTRTENQAQKAKEIIREVFGGDDRPASAPPLSCDATSENDSLECQTFDEKYTKYLEKMNIDLEKFKKISPKTEAVEKIIDKNLDSHSSIQKIEIKLERLDIEDEETQDTEINAIEQNDFVIKEEPQDKEECDTPSLISEREEVTPVGFSTVLVKKKRGNRNNRRKGSSGFDYIRKKKKAPPANASAEQLAAINMKKKIITYVEPLYKDENDISREVKGWVLNKGVGESILHKASRLGYIDAITFCLIRLEMDPDPKDNAGYTPLHEACTRGHIEIARLLLQHGANPSETAQSGIRPLHEAIGNNNIEVVRLLLCYGADPLLATYSGQTPLMLSESDEMTQFLKNHLYDIQNTGPNKTSWKFSGSWKTFEPSIEGCDVLADSPGITDVIDNISGSIFQTPSAPPPLAAKPPLSAGPSPAATTTTIELQTEIAQIIKMESEIIKTPSNERYDSNSNNIVNLEIKTNLSHAATTTGPSGGGDAAGVGNNASATTKNSLKISKQHCSVVLNDIKEITTTMTTTTTTTTTTSIKPIKSSNGDGKTEENNVNSNENDNDNDSDDLFEFEESENPLPPLYKLKDEGTEKWVLLNDLCKILNVKSKDTLLKQVSRISPTTPPSSVCTKELLRELKMSDFLEKATCLQLLCAGEKLNIRSSKVVLVKYNESVRTLLGVKTFMMTM